jgi:hypothetical protein
MTVTINASTSSGLVQTADTSGALDLQTNGTTALGFDTSGVLSFNSGYGSAAKAYGCRAWVNFNGTGTVAIRASGNVSSITDNGTGDYTVNFTTALVDANYTTIGSVQAIPATANPWIVINGYSGPTLQAPTTTACRVFCQQTGTGYDSGYICLSFFR